MAVDVSQQVAVLRVEHQLGALSEGRRVDLQAPAEGVEVRVLAVGLGVHLEDLGVRFTADPRGLSVALGRDLFEVLGHLAQDLGLALAPLGLVAVGDTDALAPRKKEDPLAKDRAACKGGDLKVCVTLGGALLKGRVGSRDPEAAAHFFKTACDGGEQGGCVQLGTLHVTGLGVDKSEEKAAALFTKACESGDMLGCARQGKLHYINRKGKSAVAMTTKACDGGAIEGCHYLGMLYLEGIGVKQKLSEARKYFQGACDGEWLEACTMLGIMLSKGDGGSKNISRAKEVLGFACERKFQNACYHLKKL